MESKISKSALAIAMTTALTTGAVWTQNVMASDSGGVSHLHWSEAFSSIHDAQSASHNWAENNDLHNTATTGKDVMSGANGNIGLNIAAGDNNLQDNATAISMSAPIPDFHAIVDSAVFVEQSASGNTTSNDGVMNASAIGDGAFQEAHGNIGVNMASGDNNLQKNNTAISVGDAILAVSSVNTNQTVCGNSSTYVAGAGNTNSAVLNGSAFKNASGNVGVNMASGSNNLQSNSMSMSTTVLPSVN